MRSSIPTVDDRRCEPAPDLLFHATTPEALERARESGLRHAILHRSLKAARVLNTGVILVVDRHAIPDWSRLTPSSIKACHIPAHAILNLRPYRPVRRVAAAGGLVMHRGYELLLCILRNGVWDLPKGKVEPGEDPATCAAREVAEETGAQDLKGRSLLATTVHGYPTATRYAVKTTYWYGFVSAAEAFTPQLEEGIERVEWLPWKDAADRMGYATLRELLRRLSGS